MRISDWSSDVCSSDLDGEDILVAATRAIDDDDLVLVHLWREPFGGGDGVGGFERGDDAFEPGQLLEAGERFRFGHRFIPPAAVIMQQVRLGYEAGLSDAGGSAVSTVSRELGNETASI